MHFIPVFLGICVLRNPRLVDGEGILYINFRVNLCNINYAGRICPLIEFNLIACVVVVVVVVTIDCSQASR